MISKILSSGAAFLIVAAMSGGCTTAEKAYHSYIMRGSIVAKQQNKVTLCIGTKDGAKPGQVLTVYRIVSTAGPSKVPANHTKEAIGKVSIEAVVDEHFATATIVSGSADVGQVAELQR